MLSFRISPDQSGQRVDKYVRRYLKDVPLSVIYKLIRTKTVRVNGARTQIGYLLQEGDEVLIRVDPAKLAQRPEGAGANAGAGAEGEARPEHPPKPPKLSGIEVIYEDDHVLAVNKPS